MSDWISLHVFYQGSLDELLVQGVLPTVAQLQGDGAIARYFFVRYWNGGPHVRLRLQPAISSDLVVSMARRELERFLSRNPSAAMSRAAYDDQVARMTAFYQRVGRDFDATEAEVAEPHQPVDTVQVRTYRFDSRRYGGWTSRTITEAHFCRSSQLAMAIVAHTLGRIEARYSVSVQLLGLVPVALHLGHRETEILFSELSGMLRYVLPEQDEDWAAAYGFLPFAEQRQLIGELIRGVRSRKAGSHSRLLLQMLDFWERELSLCIRALRELRERGKLQCEPRELVADYLHMLSNRVGISLPEECYLYHLVAKTFEERVFD